MKPTQKVAYTSGLHNTLGKIGATMSDQYAWVAQQGPVHVITAEVDHKKQENNQYSHFAGFFHKIVPPLTKESGRSHQTIRHAQELLDAVIATQLDDAYCRVLLVKGTKNGTTKGAVKAALDGDLWRVQEVSGTVAEGYEFIIYRAEENTVDN
jgi:hypothetical protein